MRVLALLLPLLLLHQASAAAQQALETKLVVQQNGREIGREEFTLRRGRGTGTAGTSLLSVARYPANSPTSQLSTSLELTPESAIAKFQLDVESRAGTTVILAAGSGARLIVRTVAKGSESGRELPGGPDVVLLDEGVHSLFAVVALLATPGGRPLTAIYPRAGKRAAFVAKRDGGEGGNIRIALSGDISGTLETDGDGRLQRLELPGQGVVVSRAE
jgi:hypothetical protein